MSGSSTVLESAETTFQQDLNGDGVIGIPSVVIESAFPTRRSSDLSNYYLYNSGVGPQLKYGGAPVVVGQIAGWAPIEIGRASCRERVEWSADGADLYKNWTTDSNGNFVSFIPAMSGSSTVLESAETTFQQDLNGDGVIGRHSVVIDYCSVDMFSYVLSNYYLYNSGVGPQLKYGGAPVVVGQIAGWAPIEGERAPSEHQLPR